MAILERNTCRCMRVGVRVGHIVLIQSTAYCEYSDILGHIYTRGFGMDYCRNDCRASC